MKDECERNEIQFNKTFIVQKSITPEQFLREVLVEIAKSSAPTNAVEVKFDKVRESLKETIVCTAHVEADCSLSVGYDRKEEYLAMEKRKEKIGNTWVTHEVPVTKVRTVTDWRPHNQHVSGDATCAELNGGKKVEWISIDEILGTIDQSKGFEDAGYVEVDSESFEKVKKWCELRVVRSQCYPGDHQKDIKYSSNTAVETLDCYILPYYEVEYTYQDKKYNAECFACGKRNIKAETPPEGKGPTELAEDETQKQKTIKKIAWIASLALYVFAWILFGVKQYWSWILPIAALACAITFHILYNKKYRETVVCLRQYKLKSKREALEKALHAGKYAPLNQEEAKYFIDQETDSTCGVTWHDGGVIWKSIVGVILSLILIITSASFSAQKKEESKRAPNKVVVSVLSKTQEAESGFYSTVIEYKIKNNAGYAVVGIEGDLKFYYDGALVSSSTLEEYDCYVEVGSSDTFRLRYEGYENVYKEIYEIPFESLEVTLKINMIYFEDQGGFSTGYYYDVEPVTIKESSGYYPPIGSSGTGGDSSNTDDDNSNDGNDGSDADDDSSNTDDDNSNDGNDGSDADDDSSNSADDSSNDGTVLEINTATIDEHAYRNNAQIKTLVIGENVQSIGDYAFFDCTSLTEIKFNATNMNDLSSSHCVFGNAGKNGNGIKVTIGSNVTKIPAYLFYPKDNSNTSNVTSVEFEEGSVCESIGKYAFYDCGLTTIEIPGSMLYVGGSAFVGCQKLVEVVNKSSALTITKGETTNGYLGYYAKQILSEKPTVSNFIASGDYTFYNNNGEYYLLGYNGTETQLTLPNDIKGSGYSIVSAAFYENDKITSVNITNNVNSIGGSAFSGCGSLQSVTIGEGVTSIGDSAFYECFEMIEIKFNAANMIDLQNGNDVFYCAGQSGTGIKVTIGKNVTKIPNYLFQSDSFFMHITNITSVEFEEGGVCNSIGRGAFGSLDSLQSVKFADTSTWYYTSTQEHNFTGGTQVNVENETINVYYLRDDYCNYYWYKVD